MAYKRTVSIACHIDGCMEALGAMIKEAMMDYAELHAKCGQDHAEWLSLKGKKRNRVEEIRFHSLDTADMDAYDSAKWFIFADREIDKHYRDMVGDEGFKLPTVQKATIEMEAEHATSYPD